MTGTLTTRADRNAASDWRDWLTVRAIASKNHLLRGHSLQRDGGHFIAHLSETPEIQLDKHLYDRDMSYYLEVIDAIAEGDRVLIAGHNPMIEETFKHLAGDSRDAQDWLAAGYPTAGLSVFRKAGRWLMAA